MDIVMGGLGRLVIMDMMNIVITMIIVITTTTTIITTITMDMTNTERAPKLRPTPQPHHTHTTPTHDKAQAKPFQSQNLIFLALPPSLSFPQSFFSNQGVPSQ